MSFSVRTYFNIQRAYLVPSVCRVWQSYQERLLVARQASPVKLAGDARCCTPGHSATFSSYTLMDVEANRVLDIQLVMVTETANSYAMELEGLQRGLAKLQDSGVTVSDLVTDRHSSVKKFMKSKPGIKHWFDVWHIAKGIQKKLEALSKKRRDLNLIQLWSRSISNHIYWVASSSNGDSEMVQQKWTSVLNHVCNIHEGHGDRFPVCEHGEMGPDDREWFRPDSRQFRELKAIVQQKLLIQDIGKLSPHVQTSSLEAFHSLICQFAPKLVRFSYHTMKARLFLAALHYNENGDREVVLDLDGQPKMRMVFPKAKKGEPIVRPIKENSTYDYVDDLWNQVVEYRMQYPSYSRATRALSSDPSPPSVTSLYPPQNKNDVVSGYRSRFNKIGKPPTL